MKLPEFNNLVPGKLYRLSLHNPDNVYGRTSGALLINLFVDGGGIQVPPNTIVIFIKINVICMSGIHERIRIHFLYKDKIYYVDFDTGSAWDAALKKYKHLDL